jgi:acyl-CoA reductase-like NAD-dependent aldehyde dehydrogenase
MTLTTPEPALQCIALQEEIVTINPSTGEELGRMPALSRSGIDAALEKSRKAQKAWVQRPLAGRTKLMAALMDVILDERMAIAELIAREQGKPIAEALAAEIVATLGMVKELVRTGSKVLAPRRVPNHMLLFGHKKSQLWRVPHGVVAIISPWNFPFSVPLPEIAAALLAGNSVVFKPAPHAILIGRKIAELLQAAGFPEDLLQVLYLFDREADYLTAHSGVDKIVFTGSTAVGRRVMANAAQNIVPVVLELGGKDPVIVAADADVQRAAKGAVWGAFFNAGQVCASIERAYVERAVAEPFIAACLQEIEKIRVGDPLLPDTDMGPLSSEAHLQKVALHIEDALQKGARLLSGGARIDRPGFFLQPTLLVDVDHGMLVMREETFGPVLPVMAVDSLDEAIRLANDSIYGLSAYAYTSSKATARRLMTELEAGTVVINDSTMSWGEPTAPWVGHKQSGIGLTHADLGLLELTQAKYVSYDAGQRAPNLWWYPYGPASTRLFAAAADLLFSRRMRRKLAALPDTLPQQRFLRAVHWGAIIRNLGKLF